MNKLDYLLSGVFENDGFSITVPIHEITAESIEEAKRIGQFKEYGEIHYNVESRELYHVLDRELTDIMLWIENKLCIMPNVLCEIAKPREKFQINSSYTRLSFDDWEKKLFSYCKENEIKQWSCNSIGYKWEDTNK